VGLSGGQDPDNRRPFPWQEVLAPAQLELRDTLEKIAKNHACLASRLSDDVSLTSLGENSLAVIRRDKQTEQPILLVVVSHGAVDNPNVPQALREHLGTHASWTDIVSGMDIPGNDHNLDTLIGSEKLHWLVPSTDVCATSGER
jgi:hypothetical protein